MSAASTASKISEYNICETEELALHYSSVVNVDKSQSAEQLCRFDFGPNSKVLEFLPSLEQSSSTSPIPIEYEFSIYFDIEILQHQKVL